LDISNEAFARAIRLFDVENFFGMVQLGCMQILLCMSDYS
jgi:hypothetical protein